MKQLRLPLVGLVVCLALCLSSCAKESDINQEERNAPAPVLESELLVSTLKSSDFLIHETSQGITDTLNMDYIRSNFFMDEMKQANLSFKVINSLDADFKMELEFLNDSNELKYALRMPVSSGSIEKPITVETIVTIKEPELKIFKEATKLVYRISQVANAKVLAPQTQGSIALQSKASFLFDL